MIEIDLTEKVQEMVKEDTNRFQLAADAFQPFMEAWSYTDWFKRGDVARVLKISPKEAGKLIRLIIGRVLPGENGWWCIKVRALFSTTSSSSSPSGGGLSESSSPLPKNIAKNKTPASFYESRLGKGYRL